MAIVATIPAPTKVVPLVVLVAVIVVVVLLMRRLIRTLWPLSLIVPLLPLMRLLSLGLLRVAAAVLLIVPVPMPEAAITSAPLKIASFVERLAARISTTRVTAGIRWGVAVSAARAVVVMCWGAAPVVVAHDIGARRWRRMRDWRLVDWRRLGGRRGGWCVARCCRGFGGRSSARCRFGGLDSFRCRGSVIDRRGLSHARGSGFGDFRRFRRAFSRYVEIRICFARRAR